MIHARQRLFFGVLAGLAVLMAGAGLATESRAESFPSKTMTLVVPFPPGSGADSTARHYAKRMHDILGQPCVVENKPGGNSFIAAQAVAQAQADGHTLFLATNSPMATNVVLFKKLPYDPVADFSPVARLTRGVNLLVVPTTSPHKSVGDLVAAARTAPGKLSYASGSASYHIATELFNEMAQIKTAHIPYKGAGQAIGDLINGTVDFAIIDISAVAQLVLGGRLRALAVTSDKRIPHLPQVPTMGEAGFADYRMYNWTAVFVPAKTPAPAIERLSQALNQITNEPEARQMIAQMGGEAFAAMPEELRKFQLSEIEKWKRAASSAKIEAQ